MKNISEILNSLFLPTADPAGIPNGNSINSKVPSGAGSFDDVLSRLNARNDAATNNGAGQSQGTAAGTNQVPTNNAATNGQNAPVINVSPGSGLDGSFLSISQTTVSINESIRVDNLNQLAQAEQTLGSLAAGLSRLLNLLSSLQGMDQAQASNALVVSGAGQISLGDAKSLLNDLQALVQKIPDSQNLLLLPADQQSAFLNQMLQQMIQGQQILLGSLTSQASPASANNSSSSGAALSTVLGQAFSAQNVNLQLLFSDTTATESLKTNAQSSQIFINLQTFQMAATFVQAGSDNAHEVQPVAGQDSNISFQSMFASGSSALSNALNQALVTANTSNAFAVTTGSAATQTAALNLFIAQDALNQNFKNLVQLLMQSGVSQAVLTTFMNQQKELVISDAKQASAQNILSENLTASLPQSVEIPPVTPANSTTASANNIIQQPKTTGRFLVSENIAEVKLAEMQTTAVTTPTLVSEKSGVPPTQPTSNPAFQSNALNAEVLKVLNDAVARLNALGAQGSAAQLSNGTEKPFISIDQILAQLAAIQPLQTSTVSFASNQSTVVNSPANPPQKSSDISNLLNELVQSQALSTGSVAVEVSNQTLITPVSLNVPLAASDLLTNQTQSTVLNALSQINNPSVNTAVQTPQALKIENTENVFTQVQPSPAQTETVVNVTTLSQEQLIQVAFSGQGIAPVSNSSIPNVVTAAPIVLNNAISVVPLVPAISAPSSVQTVVVTPLTPAISPASENDQAAVTPNAVNFQIQTISGTPITSQVPVSGLVVPPPIALTPTSTAPNISASVVMGEAIKNTVPNQTTTNSDPRNTQPSVPSTQPVFVIKPLAPEGVTAVASGSQATSNLIVPQSSGKNSGDSVSLQVNSNTLPSTATFSTAKTLENSSAAILANSSINVSSTIDGARIVNQISDQIAAQTANARTVSRLNFQLIPESLGRVTVQIALVDQSVTARILVTNPDVRDVLQHHMVDLKTALSQAGLQIDQLQVQVQGGSSSLLGQYYQYQQEGYGNRLPGSVPLTSIEEPKTIENTGVFGAMSVRTSLVDMLV